MVNRISSYYSERVKSSAPQDYLSQVGHTLGGKSIGDDQFQDLCAQIKSSLELTETDSLLDLCCGNGFLTRQLVQHVKSAVAIDLSESLLAVARSDQNSERIEYCQGNALHLEQLPCVAGKTFDKVLCYAALQHFNQQDLADILRQLTLLTHTGSRILIGFVPDIDRRWEFYNTPERKVRYLLRKLTGKEALATWWSKEEIRTTCKERGFTCSFQELPNSSHASIYRFNVTIDRVS